MDVGWLERWITVWIDLVFPQQVHLLIQSLIPLIQTFTEYLLSTKSIANAADAGIIRKDRPLCLRFWNSQPGAKRGIRSQAPFPQKKCRRQFPIYISQ